MVSYTFIARCFLLGWTESILYHKVSFQVTHKKSPFSVRLVSSLVVWHAWELLGWSHHLRLGADLIPCMSGQSRARQAEGQRQTLRQWFKDSETLLPCRQKMTTHLGSLMVHTAPSEVCSVQIEATSIAQCSHFPLF